MPTSLRIDPFRFQAGDRKRRTNLFFVLILCYGIFYGCIVIHSLLLCVVSDLVFLY